MINIEPPRAHQGSITFFFDTPCILATDGDQTIFENFIALLLYVDGNTALLNRETNSEIWCIFT